MPGQQARKGSGSVQLGRRAPRLLRTVKHQKHAENDDFFETADASTRPKTPNKAINVEEDIMRSPLSTSDEASPIKAAAPRSPTKSPTRSQPPACDPPRRSGRLKSSAAGDQRPVTQTKAEAPAMPRKRRSSDAFGGDDDGCSPARRRINAVLEPTFHNFHAPRKSSQPPKRYLRGLAKPEDRRTARATRTQSSRAQTSKRKADDKENERLTDTQHSENSTSRDPQRPTLLEALAEFGPIPSSSQPLSSGSTAEQTAGPSQTQDSSTPPTTNSSDPRPRISSLKTLEAYLEGIETGTTDRQCPLCHDRVDRADLMSFIAKHPDMHFTDQTAFCRNHKRSEARRQYAERGYPSVDWDALAARLATFWPQLEPILTGTAPSYYRAQHASKALRGAERTIFAEAKTADFGASNTGYYGPRGARAMMEAITDYFAPQLRERAPDDSVIRHGGIANFVQKVLVPELALRLVMDDCRVGEEQARQVIEQSRDIGELVHEEVEDRP